MVMSSALCAKTFLRLKFASLNRPKESDRTVGEELVCRQCECVQNTQCVFGALNLGMEIHICTQNKNKKKVHENVFF